MGTDHAVGSLEPGKEADIVVLDPESTPVLRQRTDYAQTTEELLFAMMLLGDDRAVHSVYVAGTKAR